MSDLPLLAIAETAPEVVPERAPDKPRLAPDERLQATFLAGCKAFQAGESFEYCPHRPGPEADAWRGGWGFLQGMTRFWGRAKAAEDAARAKGVKR